MTNQVGMRIEGGMSHPLSLPQIVHRFLGRSPQFVRRDLQKKFNVNMIDATARSTAISAEHVLK